MTKHKQIGDEDREAAEAQIQKTLLDVDYDTKEYPVETIVQKYATNLDLDENELFVPDYQRDFAWDAKRQSKFIESVIIGLPIPYIFVADVDDAKTGDSRLEVVDGSQRVRTLAAFVRDELVLCELEKLDALNGFKFSDLSSSRQRRFNRRTLRMIELTEKADEDVRRDIFERINTGSEELKEMEKRRGIIQGWMTAFLTRCAEMPVFNKLVVLSKASVARREREELVLRFFAYLNSYEQFQHSVVEFLDSYLKSQNSQNINEQVLQAELVRALEFVDRYFPHGFRKAGTHVRTSRIRFEALSVGVALALRARADLIPNDVSWLDSAELKTLTTSDASNSRVKVVKRIEYVRDRLLAEPKRK